jgi:DNA-binding NtrC family response regulator
MRLIARQTPVIVITTLSDAVAYLNGLKKTAFEYVFKPFRLEELLRVLRRALPPGEESDASSQVPRES